MTKFNSNANFDDDGEEIFFDVDENTFILEQSRGSRRTARVSSFDDEGGFDDFSISTELEKY